MGNITISSKISATIRTGGSESAKGIVRFKYEDSMEGTVELSMIKEDKEWKIDKVNMPMFEKLNLTITTEM